MGSLHPLNHLTNQLFNCLTAEGAEIAEETGKGSCQFSVDSYQLNTRIRRSFVALEPVSDVAQTLSC